MRPAATPAMVELVRQATGRVGVQVHVLASGGNNRVFRIENGVDTWLLKEYFRHPGDTRDRLGAEFAFSRFAWSQGVRCIPEPLGCDAANALGLYGYLRGRAPTTDDIGAPAIEAALRFWQGLNAHRDACEASLLPTASEACFTLEEHLRCLERRVGILQAMEGGAGIQAEARGFVISALSGGAARIIENARRQAGELGLALDRPLAAAERCISPSDFGYHNAIVVGTGDWRFIDFEYAGWDDPAKAVCDFFCQPAVPVPRTFLGAFLDGVADAAHGAAKCRRRVEVLMPVYRLKWCCIMLNDFLPVGGRRRHFARKGVAAEERKASQLQKARAALAQALEQH